MKTTNFEKAQQYFEIVKNDLNERNLFGISLRLKGEEKGPMEIGEVYSILYALDTVFHEKNVNQFDVLKYQILFPLTMQGKIELQFVRCILWDEKKEEYEAFYAIYNPRTSRIYPDYIPI